MPPFFLLLAAQRGPELSEVATIEGHAMIDMGLEIPAEMVRSWPQLAPHFDFRHAKPGIGLVILLNLSFVSRTCFIPKRLLRDTNFVATSIRNRHNGP